MKNTFDLSRFADIKNSVGANVFEMVVKVIEETFAPKGTIKIALIGETGVGKTSTINALFNTDLPVSHFGSCTQEDQHIKAKTPKGVDIEIIDMPGLWAGEAETQKHWATYKKVIPTVDSIIWVISAGDRALEGMQKALSRIAQFSGEDFINRVVFGINKSEHMYPEKWDPNVNLPSRLQEQYLIKFCDTVKEAIREKFPGWDGKIVYYSAKKHFRLEELLEQMLINASPESRMKVIQASDPKQYQENVEDKRALDAALKMYEKGE